MSRKDYEKFVAMFRRLRGLYGESAGLEWASGRFHLLRWGEAALIFFEDNPRFNYHRFINACDPEQLKRQMEEA